MVGGEFVGGGGAYLKVAHDLLLSSQLLTIREICLHHIKKGKSSNKKNLCPKATIGNKDLEIDLCCL